MGLPRLQPTKLCIHDGPEIMFLGLFLHEMSTQITAPATKFWHQIKAQIEYFPSVSILVIQFIIKHVSIDSFHRRGRL